MLWLALLTGAWGQDAPPTGGEQIVVMDDREEARRREAVVGKLLALGYTMGRRRDGYTVFDPPHEKPTDKWRPKVRLYDEGFAVLDGGMIGGPGLAKRLEVVEGIEPQMRSWRVAIQAKALQHRIWVELPTELDAIWHDAATAPAIRHAKLLAYWVSRTCTPEGAAVRDAIRTYIVEEVQRSEWPITPEEAAAVSTDNECEVVLDLP